MNAGADRLPIVVLISGSGSNLRAIAECARGGTLPVEIRAVISDRSAAAGLAWAATAGLPAIAISPRDFADRATQALVSHVARDAGLLEQVAQVRNVDDRLGRVNLAQFSLPAAASVPR